MIELKPAQAASQLIASTCPPMQPTQGATHFAQNLFIIEDSCAKQYFFATLVRNLRIFNDRNCDHSLVAPDLKSDLRVWATFSFILITLYSWVRNSLKLVHTPFWTTKIIMQQRKQCFCGQIPVSLVWSGWNLLLAHSARSTKEWF